MHPSDAATVQDSGATDVANRPLSACHATLSHCEADSGATQVPLVISQLTTSGAGVGAGVIGHVVLPDGAAGQLSHVLSMPDADEYFPAGQSTQLSLLA